MSNLFSLLGKKAADAEFETVIEELSSVRVIDDPPGNRYIGSPREGIDFLLEEGEVVDIQIYLQSVQSFEAFAGELPFGLSMGMKQSEVHELIGIPATTDRFSSKYSISEYRVEAVISFDEHSRAWLLSIGKGAGH